MCGGGSLFVCRVLMRSAVSILYVSRCGRRRLDMAVSASRARFGIQFLDLSCRLYFGPFCSKAISCSVNRMSVMFATLGCKVRRLEGL